MSFFSDVSIFRQVDIEGSVSIWVWLGLRYDESIGVKYVCQNVETLEHRGLTVRPILVDSRRGIERGLGLHSLDLSPLYLPSCARFLGM